MGMCQFTEGYKDFPICNVLDIGPENIGYQTGIFDDGLPLKRKPQGTNIGRTEPSLIVPSHQKSLKRFSMKERAFMMVPLLSVEIRLLLQPSIIRHQRK